MDGLDRWDVVLLAGAVYVAVTTLVRLMIRRRRELVGRLRGEARKRRGDGQNDHQDGSKAA